MFYLGSEFFLDTDFSSCLVQTTVMWKLQKIPSKVKSCSLRCYRKIKYISELGPELKLLNPFKCSIQLFALSSLVHF